jgi:hypothetical protein
MMMMKWARVMDAHSVDDRAQETLRQRRFLFSHVRLAMSLMRSME